MAISGILAEKQTEHSPSRVHKRRARDSQRSGEKRKDMLELEYEGENAQKSGVLWCVIEAARLWARLGKVAHNPECVVPARSLHGRLSGTILDDTSTTL